MKNAIVTGATGMIASALIRKLISENVNVYALTRPGDRTDDDFFSSELVKKIELDISEYGNAAGLIDAKCDVLYHFAWLGTFGKNRDESYLQNDNIKYTLDAVKLAHDTGCECFVSAGSQAEYGNTAQKLSSKTNADPVTGYGIAKFAAGKLSRIMAGQLGIRHCWVRILSVFGQKGNPNSIIMSSLKKMLDGERTSYTKCEQIWDFLHCDDAALAFYLIGEKGKDKAVYTLGSGRERKLSEYITAMRDTVDPTLEIGIGELDYNPNQVMYLAADLEELKRDTGFEPELTFEQGIERTLEWMKNQESKAK